ncbi:MAG: hypothetical protein A3G34_08650 [Candidatus Lindowbacteria bacterium RIFCSPLOWO2_12_FULL_62_27]|nr:MAG: hypothetical protein A3G34_08650 [Candidatus Lindowbacteria bacterium RIFCSPLOWO2_12_FULL_62_27]
MFYVSHVTPGFIKLLETHNDEATAMIEAAAKASLDREDHLYCCFFKDGRAEELGHNRNAPEGSIRAWFGQNETGGFTAMLPDEY